MKLDEKIGLLARTIEVDACELAPEKKLSGLEEWDSFAMILVISMLDAKFGRKLARSDLEAFATVQDILDKMESDAQ